MCPQSGTVSITEMKQIVPLQGAKTQDNTGIKSVEYRPIIDNGTAVFEEPDSLVISRDSVGHVYTVLVITKDLDDNEARCNYTITVEGGYILILS